MARLRTNPSFESILDQKPDVPEEFQNISAPETMTDASGKSRRASRSTESRSYEARVTEERPPIAYGDGSRFNLPKEVIEKYKDNGYSLSFVMYMCGKEEDKENYFSAIERGYTPVMASELPQLARRYSLSPFSQKEEDSLVRRGGQVLMKRLSDVDIAEKENYSEMHARQRIMSELHKQTDPGKPRVMFDERSRGRGMF